MFFRSVLYRAHLCMKCPLGISNFLEEISNLSHSIVFLYFFALITKEADKLLLFFGTLHSDGCIFSCLLCLLLLFFSQLFIRPPQATILPCCISFSWDGFGYHLLYNVMNLHSSSDTLFKFQCVICSN